MQSARNQRAGAEGADVIRSRQMQSARNQRAAVGAEVIRSHPTQSESISHLELKEGFGVGEVGVERREG
jgi:hypothetical protein